MRWITFCTALTWAALAAPAILQAHDDHAKSDAVAAEAAAEAEVAPATPAVKVTAKKPAVITVDERIAALEAQTQKTNDTLNDILKQLAAALKPAVSAEAGPQEGAATGTEKPSADVPSQDEEKENGESEKVVALKPPVIEMAPAEADSELHELTQRVSDLEQLSDEVQASLAKIQDDLNRLAPVVDVLSHLRVLKDTALKETSPKETAPQVAPPHTSKPGETEGEPQPPKEVLGKLTIQNDTDSTQTMLINGKSYDVLPGALDLWIPKGELTTQLEGLEEAKTWSTDDWTWRRQNFALKIIIEN